MNQFFEVSDAAALPQDPTVSILVLAYNHEAYLEEAINSLARQKAPFRYEIVIGEDASPDSTREIAFALQRKYPHLVRVLYSERNRGMAGNFRLILSQCRGKYLAGCEGDDFWIDDNKLARQVAALDAHPQVDMAFTRGYMLYADGTREPGWDYGPAPRIVPAREMFRGLGFVAPAASVMTRATMAHALPSWLDEAPIGDLFHYLAGSARGGAWYDPDFTVCYRMAQPTSFSATHERRTDEEMIRFLQTIIHYIERACSHYRVPRRVVADRLNDFQLQIAIHSYRRRRPVTALRELARVDAAFLARGATRRLARLLGRGSR